MVPRVGCLFRVQATRATEISRGPCSVALGRLCLKLGEARQVTSFSVIVACVILTRTPVGLTATYITRNNSGIQCLRGVVGNLS